MIYLYDMTTGLAIESLSTPYSAFNMIVGHPMINGVQHNTYSTLADAIQFAYDNRYRWDISLEIEIQLQKLHKEYCEK